MTTSIHVCEPKPSRVHVWSSTESSSAPGCCPHGGFPYSGGVRGLHVRRAPSFLRGLSRHRHRACILAVSRQRERNSFVTVHLVAPPSRTSYLARLPAYADRLRMDAVNHFRWQLAFFVVLPSPSLRCKGAAALHFLELDVLPPRSRATPNGAPNPFRIPHFALRICLTRHPPLATF